MPWHFWKYKSRLTGIRGVQDERRDGARSQDDAGVLRKK